MHDVIDLEYVYNELGGPAKLRRNFPRESEYGFPSLDQQCEAFPWLVVRPVLEVYAKASKQAMLPCVWPHIAQALFDFHCLDPVPSPTLRASGPRGVVEAYDRIARKVEELSNALGDLDDISLDLSDQRRPDQTRRLHELREGMWMRSGILKAARLSAPGYVKDPWLGELVRAWGERTTRSRAIVDTMTTLQALHSSAVEVSGQAGEAAGRLRRSSGPFDGRLFYLLDVLARVWITITKKVPSEALGRPGARVFTNFAVDCIALTPPSDSRYVGEVTVSNVKSLAKLAGKRADNHLRLLGQYTG